MKKMAVIWVEILNMTGGGIHRTIANLTNYMPQRGYNVTYLYSKDNYNTFILPSNVDSEPDKHLTQNELKEFLIQNSYDFILGQESAFSDTLARVVKELDIPNVKFITQYHCTLNYIYNKLNWHFLKFEWETNPNMRTRIGVIARGMLYPIWKRNVMRNQNARFKYNYENSDITLFLSARERPLMQKILNGAEPTKCRAIPNPLSWENISDTDILQNKRKEVLIVSRIYNPEKRIDLALKVWKRLQNDNGHNGWTLRIVGEGIHKPYLMNMAEKLGLTDVVWEDRANPIPYYERASIFLLTSAVEGWALTLTESMQTGVVPIAFDSYPAVRDIITDGYEGYLIPHMSVKQMAQKLQRLMDDDSLRNTMAKNGLESCRRFTIDKVMDQWRDMLDAL